MREMIILGQWCSSYIRSRSRGFPLLPGAKRNVRGKDKNHHDPVYKSKLIFKLAIDVHWKFWNPAYHVPIGLRETAPQWEPLTSMSVYVR